MERNEDVKYMRRCLQLAQCGVMGAAPNPMVGAVVVHEGRIIGEGYHIRAGGPHAEVNAIRSVRHPELLPRSTMYVSLEPCAHYGKIPPCADLIVEKRIPRVVVGCMDPFAKVNGMGIRKLRDAGVEVTVGVLEQECLWLNRRFITFHQKKRPWVTLKWAQSRDGYMDALRSAEEQPTKFSTPYTSTLVHRLRAMHQAVLVGTGTVLMDNPQLTTRLWPGESPLRLAVDRHGALPATIRLLDDAAPTHIYEDETLLQILSDLHARGVQSLLVEGGARLLQRFVDEGLWDEARVETAPFSLHSGVPAPRLPEKIHHQNQVTVDGRIISNFYRSEKLHL